MKRLMVMMVAASAMMWAQAKGNEAPQAPPAQPGDIVRVIQLKEAQVYTVVQMLERVLGGLAAVSGNGNQKTLIVRGSPEAVKVIEEAVMKLDVAPPPEPPRPPIKPFPTIEMTAYLVRGSAQAASDEVPESLAGTIRQLHGLFPYKAYQLLDTLLLQGSNQAKVASSSTLPGTATVFEMEYTPSIQANTDPRSLYLSNLHLTLRRVGTIEASLSTSLSIQEGQKTVIGKSNVVGTNDAIILVMTPRIVE